MTSPHTIRLAALIIGPVVGILVALTLFSYGWSQEAALTGAITSLCIIWWIFEPIPIPVTSLIPIALIPLLGILSDKDVAQAYGNKLILLLMGGFILSTAMSHSGAHKRIALLMVNLVGGHSGRRIVFGFMLASALLSMWISNTATTLMLLPVALAVLDQASDKRLTIPLLLGIAYAASLGGLGTPIGTPPNLIFMQVYTENTGQELGFSTWMAWGVPTVLLFLPLMGLWLTRQLKPGQAGVVLPEVGPWRVEEKRVLSVFAITALAWITRSEPFGGWSAWLNLPGAHDGSVALIAVIALFLIPNGKKGRLLTWQRAADIPWGMLILFAGGITIAKAFVSTGLSGAIGELLSGFAAWPLLIMLAMICLLVTFLTEMTSNTATTTLLMPILAAGAIGASIDPKLFMVPAAMSASCAFMLPVATVPNTVVFSSGRFSIQTMVQEGLILNFIGAFVITLVCYIILT